MGETLGGGLFERQVVARAETGVDGECDREWQRGFLIEHRNPLLVIVLPEDKILPGQTSDRGAVLVRHGHEHVHQLDVDPQGFHWLRLTVGARRSLLSWRLLD